jgi:hypothetical protein
MDAKRALSWTFGTGLAAYLGMWYFMGRLPLLDRAATYVWLAFLSGALAVALLAPVAMRSDRRWLRRAAALLPWPVLAFSLEQGWERYVNGAIKMDLGGVELIAGLVLGGLVLSWREADRDARRWMLYGTPLLLLAPMTLMDNFGYAMLLGQVLSLVVVVGLLLDLWAERSSTQQATPHADGPRQA